MKPRELSHPYVQSLAHNRRVLHLSAPLPVGLNPLAVERINLQLALCYGETRSIKEMVAYQIITHLLEEGRLRPGNTAIDATSGNTGPAYAGILQPLGIRLKLIVQGSIPASKLNRMRVYGQGVEIIPHSDAAESTVARARREAEEFGYVLLDQYANPDNPRAHELYTARELERQLNGSGGSVGAIVVPLGTCGTAIGLAHYFKPRDRYLKIIGVAVDPDQKTPQIPGIRTPAEIEANVRHPRAGLIDEVRLVKRHDAVRATRRLFYAESSWPGLSTGAAYVVATAYAVEHKRELSGKRVVIMAPDSAEAYLDILNAEPDDADIEHALDNRPEF